MIQPIWIVTKLSVFEADIIDMCKGHNEAHWWLPRLHTSTYMAMEYITLTNPPPDLPERTAEALRWLSAVPEYYTQS
jgi:hypothetical protein